MQTNHFLDSYNERSIHIINIDKPLSCDWGFHAYKPFDKAGSYGIQEWIGLIAISKIEGSYTNVVGLPTEKVFHYLKNLV